MAGEVRSGAHLGRGFGLFAIALAVFVVVVAFVAEIGLDDEVVVFLVMAMTLVTYLVIGMVTRTLSLSDFFVAGRRMPAGLNGMATAVGLVSATGFLGLVGAFFVSSRQGVAVSVGWIGGLILLAVLVAPYYRKSGAVTLPDFLAVRFGNPLVRLIALLILIATTFPLLAAALLLAAGTASPFLGIPFRSVLTGTLVIVVLSSLLGGMRAVTFVAGTQAIVVLAALFAPVALWSSEAYHFPLAQLTFGFAVEETRAAAGGAIELLSSAVMPLAGLDWFNLFAVAVTFAAAAAAMPHVVARSGTVASIGDARRSVGWTLLFVAVLVMTAPAIAAFAKAAMIDAIAAVGPDDLPQWLFDYGSVGLFKFCGVDATSPEAVKAACGAGALGPLGVNPDGVGLAFADITDLPYVMTALIAAGAIAAALAGANLTLITIASAFGHDFYAGLIDRRAPAGRRLIASRLGILAAAIAAAWCVVERRDDVLAIAVLAPPVAASAFFPSLILGIWWRRATFWGALAGMLVGFGVAAGYAWLIRYGGGAPRPIVGLTGQGITAVASAILGLPAGFVAVIVVSYLTPAPSPARLEVVDAIRRPTRDPILEDHAV